MMARPSRQPDGRKSLLIRVEPEKWKALRDCATQMTLEFDETVTVQSLVYDLIAQFLMRVDPTITELGGTGEQPSQNHTKLEAF